MPINQQTQHPGSRVPITSDHEHKQRTYGSLRGRIQSGMFYSAFLTLLTMVCLLLLMISFMFKPISLYLSKSVTQDIYMRLNTMNAYDNNIKDKLEMENLDKKTLDELLAYANTMYTENLTQPNLIMDGMAPSDMIPDSIVTQEMNDSFKKMTVISVLSAIEEFNRRFPIKQTLTIDPILVEFKDASDAKILCIPVSAHKNSIDFYRNVTTKEQKQLKQIFMDSMSELKIVNPKGEVIGMITTSLNPYFVYIVIAAIVFILVIVTLCSLPINLMLIKFHSKNIIKPITQLNKQLSLLAKNDFFGIGDFHFQVKRPPRELVTLMNSATQIMEHLNDFNQELDAQKQELEAQNIELEVQNVTLTDSKNMIQEQQDQLVRIEKMATLGQISAAIAHEINTPLGAIKSNIQMMEMVLGQLDTSSCDPILQKKLARLKDMNSISTNASERVTEIIRSLKNFSRIDQADFQDFDVHEGIDSVLVLTSNLWKNNITIEKQYGEIPILEGYASMLNQVFMNIVVNAIQAMDDSGILTITTEATESAVKISFKDSGKGIAPQLLERVFESGYTTKDINQGTGLGLAISKDIIAKHNGRIYALNHQTKGATFVIELPLHQPTPA